MSDQSVKPPAEISRAETAPGTPASGAALVPAIRRAISQPQFLVAFVVLFVAAMSLGAATSYMKLYFKKEPVPLVKQLEQIPGSLGNWVQVSSDRELNDEMLDVLGTREYIFRDYVDSRIVDQATIDQFKQMTDSERGKLLSTIERQHPEAAVRLSVTYYTGMVDTVAHIPDRCYVAGDMNPTEKTTPVWTLMDRNHQPLQTRVSSIHFEASHDDGIPTRNVAYFFHCNGSYEHDAITGVRRKLQNLFERRAYYAKIEVLTLNSDYQKSDAVLQDFLSSALPEIEQCFPDWQKLHEQSK